MECDLCGKIPSTKMRRLGGDALCPTCFADEWIEHYGPESRKSLLSGLNIAKTVWVNPEYENAEVEE